MQEPGSALGTAEHPLRVAVVGSGPSGFYAAEALLASLDEHCGHDAEAAWKTEIERRITELDAGAVSPIPWPEVRQRLFERARRRALKRLRAGLDLQWAPMGSRDDLHRR